MKVALSLAVVASLVATTGAFAPQFSVTRSSHQNAPALFMNADCDEEACDIDFDAFVFDAVPEQGASGFRNSMLTDADGNFVRLGDKMGSGKSVVIFLRHLG